MSALAAGLLWAAAASALDLKLPEAAALAAEDRATSDSIAIPVGPWTRGILETRTAEGVVTKQAWVIRNSLKTTLQLLEPLRESIVDAGYRVIFECHDTSCGGFDFRYALSLLPEPQMHVDLGDYRYIAALPAEGDGLVSLMVSRSANSGYVHITTVGASVVSENVDAGTVDVSIARPLDPNPAQSDLTAQLGAAGRAVLDDLRFATGSSELEAAPFASLEVLAGWLADRPEVQVALVGHSDAVGSLAQNIDLSRRRAASVMRRLVEAHGLSPAQVSAEGVGFLAPRASNATPEGRALNRRVEVVRITP